MGVMTLTIVGLVAISALILCGFISILSFKERRELYTRVMCKNADEYIMVTGSETARVQNPYLTKSEQLIKKFKEKGVNS